ncbi:MAG: hypothetical protein KAU20_02435 [Nanoarchaeota archaeon]|nr:hypothetical protein [Nanoarchaeota archaeon]
MLREEDADMGRIEITGRQLLELCIQGLKNRRVKQTLELMRDALKQADEDMEIFIDKRQKLSGNVLAWLGVNRDKLPAEAVDRLQNICNKGD